MSRTINKSLTGGKGFWNCHMKEKESQKNNKIKARSFRSGPCGIFADYALLQKRHLPGRFLAVRLQAVVIHTGCHVIGIPVN